MQLTAVEKLMYEVMKAVYDSGIPISFKGSMVLRACLLEAGYSEEMRHTVDIDAICAEEGCSEIRRAQHRIGGTAAFLSLKMC